MHVPSSQNGVLPSQRLLQPPQLNGSFAVCTHAPLQQSRPTTQSMARTSGCPARPAAPPALPPRPAAPPRCRPSRGPAASARDTGRAATSRGAARARRRRSCRSFRRAPRPRRPCHSRPRHRSCRCARDTGRAGRARDTGRASRARDTGRAGRARRPPRSVAPSLPGPAGLTPRTRRAPPQTPTPQPVRTTCDPWFAWKTASDVPRPSQLSATSACLTRKIEVRLPRGIRNSISKPSAAAAESTQSWRASCSIGPCASSSTAFSRRLWAWM